MKRLMATGMLAFVIVLGGCGIEGRSATQNGQTDGGDPPGDPPDGSTMTTTDGGQYVCTGCRSEGAGCSVNAECASDNCVDATKECGAVTFMAVPTGAIAPSDQPSISISMNPNTVTYNAPYDYSAGFTVDDFCNRYGMLVNHQQMTKQGIKITAQNRGQDWTNDQLLHDINYTGNDGPIDSSQLVVPDDWVNAVFVPASAAHVTCP